MARGGRASLELRRNGSGSGGCPTLTLAEFGKGIKWGSGLVEEDAKE